MPLARSLVEWPSWLLKSVCLICLVLYASCSFDPGQVITGAICVLLPNALISVCSASLTVSFQLHLTQAFAYPPWMAPSKLTVDRGLAVCLCFWQHMTPEMPAQGGLISVCFDLRTVNTKSHTQGFLGAALPVSSCTAAARYMWRDAQSIQDFIMAVPSEVHCLFLTYAGETPSQHGCSHLCEHSYTAYATNGSVLCLQDVLGEQAAMCNKLLYHLDSSMRARSPRSHEQILRGMSCRLPTQTHHVVCYTCPVINALHAFFQRTRSRRIVRLLHAVVLIEMSKQQQCTKCTAKLVPLL